MKRSLATLGLAAACLATPLAAQAQTAVPDPWEASNRKAYELSNVVDRGILSPLARGYRAVTSRPIRRGVDNFLNNLHTPVVLVNDLLQGDLGAAGTTAARFGINSTVGLLGLLDPAADMQLVRRDEDFGQTLAGWGVPSGPYVFAPLAGPSTVRDSVGSIVDLAFDPLNWAHFHGDDATRITRGAVTAVSAREGLLDATDSLNRTSVDPYVTIRSTYALTRDSAVRNGAGPADMPEMEEIPEDLNTDEQVTTTDSAAAQTQPDQMQTTTPAPATPPSGDQQ